MSTALILTSKPREERGVSLGRSEGARTAKIGGENIQSMRDAHQEGFVQAKAQRSHAEAQILCEEEVLCLSEMKEEWSLMIEIPVQWNLEFGQRKNW